MTAAEFQQHLHRTIPISHQMGIQVAFLDGHRCLLKAPLAPNINHVHTVFGGSLYAVSALACYGLFWALAAETQFINDNLVIQNGQIQYLLPVNGDFEVESLRPSEAEMKKFFELLKRHGKARLDLRAEIRIGTAKVDEDASVVHRGGKVAAIFTGTYVSRLQT